MSIETFAKNAAIERLWSYTVGIENRALVSKGTDPANGLRTTELSSPGTGVAGLWGKTYFVLTAAHVLEQARINDLSFFVRQQGELQTKLVSEIKISDAVAGAPLGDSGAAIHRCDWEDLALLIIGADALGSNLEFFDIKGSWADPSPGESVAGIGYPVSSGVQFQRRDGNALRKAVVLSPVPFSGEVLPRPNADDLRFKFPKCNPDRHYLITYEHAETGKRPEGISGAAVWVEERSGGHVLWAPRFRFAGICTSCYKNGTIEKVVKASVVRQFLRDIFESPDESNDLSLGASGKSKLARDKSGTK